MIRECSHEIGTEAGASTYHCTAAEAELHVVPDHGCRHVRRIKPGRRPAAAVPCKERRELVSAIRRHCNTLRSRRNYLMMVGT